MVSLINFRYFTFPGIIYCLSNKNARTASDHIFHNQNSLRSTGISYKKLLNKLHLLVITRSVEKFCVSKNTAIVERDLQKLALMHSIQQMFPSLQFSFCLQITVSSAKSLCNFFKCDCFKLHQSG